MFAETRFASASRVADSYFSCETSLFVCWITCMASLPAFIRWLLKNSMAWTSECSRANCNLLLYCACSACACWECCYSRWTRALFSAFWRWWNFSCIDAFFLSACSRERSPSTFCLKRNDCSCICVSFRAISFRESLHAGMAFSYTVFFCCRSASSSSKTKCPFVPATLISSRFGWDREPHLVDLALRVFAVVCHLHFPMQRWHVHGFGPRSVCRELNCLGCATSARATSWASFSNIVAACYNWTFLFEAHRERRFAGSWIVGLLLVLCLPGFVSEIELRRSNWFSLLWSITACWTITTMGNLKGVTACWFTEICPGILRGITACLYHHRTTRSIHWTRSAMSAPWCIVIFIATGGPWAFAWAVGWRIFGRMGLWVWSAVGPSMGP